MTPRGSGGCSPGTVVATPWDAASRNSRRLTVAARAGEDRGQKDHRHDDSDDRRYVQASPSRHTPDLWDQDTGAAAGSHDS